LGKGGLGYSFVMDYYAMNQLSNGSRYLVLLSALAAIMVCMCVTVCMQWWLASERGIQHLTDLISGQARHSMASVTVTRLGRSTAIRDGKVLGAIESQLWDARSRRIEINEANQRIEDAGNHAIVSSVCYVVFQDGATATMDFDCEPESALLLISYRFDMDENASGEMMWFAALGGVEGVKPYLNAINARATE
jgi:hypothetical protein